METGRWLVDELADDVGMNVGDRAIVDRRVVELHVVSRVVERGRQRGDAASARSAEILAGVFERNAESHLLTGVSDEADARDAAPKQAVSVVDVHHLRIEEVRGQR